MAESKPATAPVIVSTGASAAIPTCDLVELLQDAPLHAQREISMLFDQPEYGDLGFPAEIRLHCDHKKCEGVRRHIQVLDNRFQLTETIFHHHVVYSCSNCNARVKTFILKAERTTDKKHSGFCTKIYQEPTFGSPIPRRLFEIIGEENRKYFLQARRAIACGLGVGAYSYYRRIVESAKFDMVSSFLAVAKATDASAAQIELLQKAKLETQFSKAVKILRARNAIPTILLIEGHNPLLLVHDLLSEGIQKLSDCECLDRAQETEVILCEIANRMQIAMTERKALRAAITSIMNRKVAEEKAATRS